MSRVRRRLIWAGVAGAWVVACAAGWGSVSADSEVAEDTRGPSLAGLETALPHLDPSTAGQPGTLGPPGAASGPESSGHSVAPVKRGGSGAEPDTAAPDSATPDPVFSRVILRLRARAQARILGESQLIEDESGRIVPASQIGEEPDEEVEEVELVEAAPFARPNGNELGRFVPVENEGALSEFHRALEELLSHPELKRKVRIAAYGASHTQADIYTGYLRHYLQSRFGNGGIGFVPVGLDRAWARRQGYKVKTNGFQVQYAQQKPPPRHGRFGLSGSAAVAGPHATINVRPRNDTDRHLAASRYGLFFGAEPRGGSLAVSFDGEAPVYLKARATSPQARYHTFVKPLGWHSVKIRSSGEGAVRLFGMSIEREQPGLVIDTLGIRGTRAANMLQWDRDIWGSHLEHRSPDLVTLAYGTNETTDRGQPIETYELELREVLSRLRQSLPKVSCVLVGPGDFPRLVNNRWVERPRLLEIIEVQRRVAPDFDCGFWDTYAFMGGPGSMQRWVKAKPPLGSGDRIHFTIRGYVKMGMMLGDALMRAYDERHLPVASRVTPARARSERSASVL